MQYVSKTSEHLRYDLFSNPNRLLSNACYHESLVNNVRCISANGSSTERGPPGCALWGVPLHGRGITGRHPDDGENQTALHACQTLPQCGLCQEGETCLVMLLWQYKEVTGGMRS